jgi:hypothetical protein
MAQRADSISDAASPTAIVAALPEKLGTPQIDDTVANAREEAAKAELAFSSYDEAKKARILAPGGGELMDVNEFLGFANTAEFQQLAQQMTDQGPDKVAARRGWTKQRQRFKTNARKRLGTRKDKIYGEMLYNIVVAQAQEIARLKGEGASA